MIDPAAEENRLLKRELADLRAAILLAEPAVLYDGRFERMFTSPIAVIGIARDLLSRAAAGSGRSNHAFHDRLY